MQQALGAIETRGLGGAAKATAEKEEKLTRLIVFIKST